jgi:beta-fructofuranosidase
MLHAPESPLHGLWDTWLFPADDGYHLFYLKRDLRDMFAKSIAHAVSPDLVHWTAERDALHSGDGNTWDSGWLMTGMVVRHHDGRYYMFYGAMVDQVQRIGVAISDDLHHWHKHPKPVMEACAPFYETDPRRSPNHEVAWRDPCIVYDATSQQYYAFICARVPNGSYSGGACIAVCRSRDLLSWETLPPAFISDEYVCMEVPDVFALDGRYYLMFSTARWFDSYYQTSDPHCVNGTFYLVSDDLLSGWRRPAENIVIASRESRLDSYVGRSVMHPSDGSRLFYHHMVRRKHPNDVASFGAVKQLATTSDGALRVLARRDVDRFTQPLSAQSVYRSGGKWLTADSELCSQADAPSLYLLYQAEAALIETQLAFESEGGIAGVVIGYGSAAEQGLCIVLDRTAGQVEVSLCGAEFGALRRFPPLQARRADLRGAVHRLRVLVRAHYLDVYLDDALLIAFSWAHLPYGKAGFYAERTTVRFRDSRFAALTF